MTVEKQDDPTTPSYPVAITKTATEYGYKTANLQFLSGIIKDNPNTPDNIAVPEFFGITNLAILAHLDAYAPKWRDLWEEFKARQAQGSDTLSDDAKAMLTKLRGLIEQTFKDHVFTAPDLPDNQLFMVRSTSNEDRVDLANPGGNESVPSTKEDISASIGKVVASYVSENSLSQRLKSGENVTDEYPLSACLVQTMVGEGLSVAGTGAKPRPPVSGVVYTDNGHVRIQAAPGHGELIVNSKGNFDNYYVTPSSQVYSEVREKRVRMVPTHDKEHNKMSLVTTDNDDVLASEQSLDIITARKPAKT